MELSVEHVGAVTIARLSFESLNVNNARDFRSAMENLLKQDSKIVLDMGALAFIDSSGIGALVACVKMARSLKGDVKLSTLTLPVQNLLALVRVNRFVQVFDVVDDAVRSFSCEEAVS